MMAPSVAVARRRIPRVPPTVPFEAPMLAKSVLGVASVLFLFGSTQRGESPTRKSFVDLAAKGDSAGIVALWKANPGEAIGTIDQDLEGFLAKIEKKSGDAKEIQAMKDRALLGAKCADEAFGRPIFGDYASAFAGWNENEQQAFRQGQKLAGDAGKAVKDKKWEEAVKYAEQCIQLTENLGDWWGLATGYTTLAGAYEGAGQYGDALAPCQMARILHHDMEMASSELRDTVQMARLLVKLNRETRARVTAESGVALAAKLKNAKAEAELKELLGKLGK
jgi:tetratricopeptide (TPR) repeat protein